MENDTRKTRLIFDYKTARALLKKGNFVIDIKPLRDDKSKCVLIFENTEQFNKDLEVILAELEAKKSNRSEMPGQMSLF